MRSLFSSRLAPGYLTATLAVCINVACGDPAASEAVAVVVSGVDTHGADPESMLLGEVSGSSLSAEERAFLAHAKGRQWEPISAADLSKYLAYAPSAQRLVYIWDRSTGAEGLRGAVRSRQTSDGQSLEVAVVAVSPADAIADQIALRESQVVVAAYSVEAGVLATVLGADASAGSWFASAVSPSANPTQL